MGGMGLQLLLPVTQPSFLMHIYQVHILHILNTSLAHFSGLGSTLTPHPWVSSSTSSLIWNWAHLGPLNWPLALTVSCLNFFRFIFYIDHKVILQNLESDHTFPLLTVIYWTRKKRSPPQHHPTPKPPRGAEQISLWGKAKIHFTQHIQPICCFCNSQGTESKAQPMFLDNWKTQTTCWLSKY